MSKQIQTSYTSSMENIIATKHMDAVDRQTNENRMIQFQLGAPYPIDDGLNYMCPVRILVNDSVEMVNVGGVDSMQSLSLAIGWLRSRFEQLRSETYDFYWTGSNDPIESFDYRIDTSSE